MATIALTSRLRSPSCVWSVIVYHCRAQVFHRDWQMRLNISSTRSSVTERWFITDRGVKRSQTLTGNWLVFLRRPSPHPSNNCCGCKETSARSSSAGFSVLGGGWWECIAAAAGVHVTWLTNLTAGFAYRPNSWSNSLGWLLAKWIPGDSLLYWGLFFSSLEDMGFWGRCHCSYLTELTS